MKLTKCFSAPGVGGYKGWSMIASRSRPFVQINVAATADGKLAPHTRRFVPFTTRRDQQLLFELRSQADAVMCGARTVDLGPVDLGPGPVKHRRARLRNGLAEYNLRVIVSGSGSVNPEAEIFRHRFSPIIVLATEQAPRERIERLQRVADEVKICGGSAIDFARALRWLHDRWKVKRLLCEGGGEINAGLFREKLVDEVCMTLAPLIFGGRGAPTVVDGEGIANVDEATRLRLESCERAGNELYLIYRVSKTRKKSLRRV